LSSCSIQDQNNSNKERPRKTANKIQNIYLSKVDGSGTIGKTGEEFVGVGEKVSFGGENENGGFGFVGISV
jgi:hypothetical protein